MKAQKLRGREKILSARIASIFVLTTLLLSAPLAQALPVDKDFTSSGQILDGEEWNNVSIYNDDTIVDMLGGLVDQMQTYDSSMLNVTGGEIYSLYTREYSFANISGGTLGGVMTWDHATANLFDGGSVFSLGAGVSGIINMMGGTTEYLHAGGSCTFNLYGGAVTDSLNAWDFATVNIYGYGFDYDPSAGNYNGGQLTGLWFDDTTFTIDLYDTVTYDHINLVPEPSSLILFALSALLLIRKK
jgi:hypothetical protein